MSTHFDQYELQTSILLFLSKFIREALRNVYTFTSVKAWSLKPNVFPAFPLSQLLRATSIQVLVEKNIQTATKTKTQYLLYKLSQRSYINFVLYNFSLKFFIMLNRKYREVIQISFDTKYHSHKIVFLIKAALSTFQLYH